MVKKSIGQQCQKIADASIVVTLMAICSLTVSVAGALDHQAHAQTDSEHGIVEETPSKGSEGSSERYQEKIKRYEESQRSQGSSPETSTSPEPTNIQTKTATSTSTDTTKNEQPANVTPWLIGSGIVLITLLGCALWFLRKRK